MNGLCKAPLDVPQIDSSVVVLCGRQKLDFAFECNWVSSALKKAAEKCWRQKETEKELPFAGSFPKRCCPLELVREIPRTSAVFC